MTADPRDCPHPETEPVDVDGLTVARICTTCLDQVPLGWGCEACTWVDVTQLCDPFPRLALGRPCEEHRP